MKEQNRKPKPYMDLPLPKETRRLIGLSAEEAALICAMLEEWDEVIEKTTKEKPPVLHLKLHEELRSSFKDCEPFWEG